MTKGIITITKNGGGKIKPYESRKEISVPREFEYGERIPSSGKNKFECEFEFSEEENKVVKLIIEGKEISKSDRVLQHKEEKIKQALEAEKLSKEKEQKEREERKRKQSQPSNSSYSIPDSIKLTETFLPNDVQGISNLKDIDNFNLKFQKAARFIEDERGRTDKDKFYFYKNDFNPKRNTGHKFHIKANFDTDFIEYIVQNQKSNIDEAKTKVVEMSLDWRLAIGLGIDNIYETGISLHHLYGVPYIPASSVKGIVRSWYILKNYGLDKKGEEESFKKQDFCSVFGSDDNGIKNQATQGRIVFFDAFPTSEPKVEVDIMNPHYPDYYGDSDNKKNVAPTDFQNPIPINFLTVKGCNFQFIIGVRNVEDKELLETATKWLKEALTQKGIGAKTAVGYGYMSENQ